MRRLCDRSDLEPLYLPTKKYKIAGDKLIQLNGHFPNNAVLVPLSPQRSLLISGSYYPMKGRITLPSRACAIVTGTQEMHKKLGEDMLIIIKIGPMIAF